MELHGQFLHIPHPLLYPVWGEAPAGHPATWQGFSPSLNTPASHELPKATVSPPLSCHINPPWPSQLIASLLEPEALVVRVRWKPLRTSSLPQVLSGSKPIHTACFVLHGRGDNHPLLHCPSPCQSGLPRDLPPPLSPCTHLPPNSSHCVIFFLHLTSILQSSPL